MISEYPVWEIVGPRINIPTETGGDERESGLVSALPLKADVRSALSRCPLSAKRTLRGSLFC